MKELLAYAGALLGLLSFPALFFLALRLTLRRTVPAAWPGWGHWTAAAAFSAGVAAACWGLYLHGSGLQPYLPLPHLTFAYSAYAVLPVALLTAAVCVLGAACSAIFRHRN